VRAASRARRAFLAEARAQYEANRARIDSARAEASLAFDASLHAAEGDTTESRAAERANLAATQNAYLRAGVKRTDYARSSEASYHAMLRGSLMLSDSARTAMARNYARVLVIASDTAMRDEFRQAGASSARLDLVAQASARFHAAVDSSRSRSSMDSAVARFRADVRAVFTDTSGSDASFNGFAGVIAQVAVTTLLDSLSTSLQAQIALSGEGESVGQAYAETHAEAQAELQTRLSAVGEEDEASAAANVMAFLLVRSSHN
jgi:hypothetical protein